MRSLLLACLLSGSCVAFAGSDLVQPGDLDPHQGTSSQLNTTLVDTRAGVDPPAFAVVSSYFTDPVLSGFNTAAGDDFSVLDCAWELTTLRVYGSYSNPINPMITGPATSVRVYILPKSGGVPGTDLAAQAIYFDENLSYTELDPVDGGDFEIVLPNVVLPVGDYWLFVQANIELFSVGQWNWTESSLAPNSGTTNGDESVWFQNTAGVASPMTGNAECVGAMGDRISNCGMTRDPDPKPPFDGDLAFQLDGDMLSAGGSLSESSINTIEDGSNATYQVTLDAPPRDGETVTVTPVSDDPGEGSVSGAMTFDDTNWDQPQTVTVQPGASGDGNDGDVTYIITHDVSSDDPAGCYPAATLGSVSVTNQNIDGTATLLVDPSSGITVDELGNTTGTVTISAGPDVVPGDTINIAVSTTSTDIMIVPSNLMLDSGNGYSQSFSVSGLVDDAVEGTEGFSIVTAASSSGDPLYNDIDPVDITGSVLDDNVAQVIVTPSNDPLQTNEAGAQDSINYVLTARPTEDVSIALQVDDPNEASLSTDTLIFTAADWDQPQTVTVAGVDDPLDDGLQTYTVSASPTSSTDPFWDGLAVSSVSGENADDTDTAAVIVDGGNGIDTSESGTIDFFTVVLATEPLFPVTMDITSSNPYEGLLLAGVGIPEPTVSRSISFDNSNWFLPVTVTVYGQDDNIDDGDVNYQITFDASESQDPIYDNITPPPVEATNKDDDLAPIFYITIDLWGAGAFNVLDLTALVNGLSE